MTPNHTWPSGFGRSRRRSAIHRRSEEHTSELQSQSNLVCRLLLEKKKIHIRTLFVATLLPPPNPRYVLTATRDGDCTLNRYPRMLRLQQRRVFPTMNQSRRLMPSD